MKDRIIKCNFDERDKLRIFEMDGILSLNIGDRYNDKEATIHLNIETAKALAETLIEFFDETEGNV